jgi:hypothetical protein
MFFFAIAAVVGLGCVLALGFGAAALNPAKRAGALSRYPLQVVSWIIATPFFGLSVLGVVLGASSLFSSDDVAGSDDGDGGDFFDTAGGLVLAAVTLALAALCVAAVVMCSRAARGKFARGPASPAVLGFASPLVVGVFLGLVGLSPFALFILLVSAGAGVNGLLAIAVNKGRREGLLPVNPDATLPPVVAPTAPQPTISQPPAPPSAAE